MIIFLVIVEIGTGKVTVGWTPGDNLYEYHIIRGYFTDKTPEQPTEYTKVEKPNNEWEVTRYRSGHFALGIRACMIRDGEEVCSEEVRSDIEGKPEPWIIYWKPFMPSNVIIENF